MKHRLGLIVLVLIGTFSAFHQAKAGSGGGPLSSITYSLSCSSVSFTINFPTATEENAAVEIGTAYKADNVLVREELKINPGFNSYSFSFPEVGPGTTLYLTITDGDELNPEIDDIPINCGGAITFCNLSGDGRYDGFHCGDRVVVYCSKGDQSYSIYGVDNSSRGLFLGKFSHASLHQAGPKGQTLTSQYGAISISEDAQGNFYAAWNWPGGPVPANGQEDFTKGGKCSFSK